MRGAVAIVTGASSGIGAEVARQLATAGARVVIVGRHRGRLERITAEVEAAGGESLSVEADLVLEGGPDRVVEAAVERFGTIDILVHSAGIYEPGPLAALSAATLDRTWATNVRAPLRLTQAALPHLGAKGGSVTFISSISGRVGFANEAAYAGTKAAVEGMTRALAVELAPSGIRVNCVAPRLHSHANERGDTRGRTRRDQGGCRVHARRPSGSA